MDTGQRRKACRNGMVMEMSRSPDERVSKAYELYKAGMKLTEIADQLGIPSAGTVRSWKNRYNWDGEGNATLQKNKRNVAKEKKVSNKAVVDEVIKNTELTDKQRLFCAYYIRSFNATKAYQKAYGVDYATALCAGPRLLGNDRIKEQILQMKKERLNQELLSEEDVFQKYMDIAFADLTDYVEFGTEEVPVMAAFGPVQIKDPETGEKKQLTKVVNTVRFKPSAEVDGTILSEVKQGRDGASIKLADRMKALQFLSDHMDMATEEQRARVAIMKAKLDGNSGTVEDDGFLEALNATAAEDWTDNDT